MAPEKGKQEGGQWRNAVCLTNFVELVELYILLTSTRGKKKVKTREKGKIGPIINSLVHGTLHHKVYVN